MRGLRASRNFRSVGMSSGTHCWSLGESESRIGLAVKPASGVVGSCGGVLVVEGVGSLGVAWGSFGSGVWLPWSLSLALTVLAGASVAAGADG